MLEEVAGMSALVEIVLGGVLLVLSRKLFWLFVGAVGFAFGVYLAQRLLPGLPEWAFLAAGLLLAFIGVGLAMTLQKLAIGLAGFIAGGWVAVWLLGLLAIDAGGFQWLVFIVGGILGAILLTALFEWGLILLSSLVGANLVLLGLEQTLNLTESLALIALFGLFGLGVLIQARMLRRS
jgi:hypothetical protein